ncbi:uncharacterized protein LOC131850314 [Achroia grisella]|uniref:uncharacterized protein LOC131850314 n=1 Tax=Achroia grisella TaxID=688607 RepID=UPI0027D1FD68|nr:uncharacterized protein LOC131850314 [Achroia grisella]
MIRQVLFVLTICIIFLEIQRTNSYKTFKDLKKRYKKIENDDFTASDVLVGKAMDFIYSNKTIMSLIARELWNVGSKAIDRIVEMKGPDRKS